MNTEGKARRAGHRNKSSPIADTLKWGTSPSFFTKARLQRNPSILPVSYIIQDDFNYLFLRDYWQERRNVFHGENSGADLRITISVSSSTAHASTWKNIKASGIVYAAGEDPQMLK